MTTEEKTTIVDIWMYEGSNFMEADVNEVLAKRQVYIVMRTEDNELVATPECKQFSVVLPEDAQEKIVMHEKHDVGLIQLYVEGDYLRFRSASRNMLNNFVDGWLKDNGWTEEQ